MPGVGQAPGGTSPFGIGTPVGSGSAPTGAAGSRFIDPQSGDFQQDSSTLQLAQMPPVRQRVLLALMTRKGSSSVLPNLGISVPPKLDETFQRKVENSVRSALRTLTDVERVVRVNGILAEKHPGGRVLVLVSFTDLTTGRVESASVPLAT